MTVRNEAYVGHMGNARLLYMYIVYRYTCPGSDNSEVFMKIAISGNSLLHDHTMNI